MRDVAPQLISYGVGEDGKRTYLKTLDTRVVLFHAEMLPELFASMSEIAGPVMAGERQTTQMKEFGIATGRMVVEEIEESMEQTGLIHLLRLFIASGFDTGFIREMGKTDADAQLTKIAGLAPLVGWAQRIDVLDREPGEYLRVAVYNSFEADSHGETGHRECDFLLGTTHGVASALWDWKNIRSHEEQCISEGYDYCIWVVSGEA